LFDPTAELVTDFNVAFNLTIVQSGVSTMYSIAPALSKSLSQVEFLWPATSSFADLHQLTFFFDELPAHSSPVGFSVYVGSSLRISSTLPAPEELDMTVDVTAADASITQSSGTQATFTIKCPDCVLFDTPQINERFMVNITVDRTSTVNLAIAGATATCDPLHCDIALLELEQHHITVPLTPAGLQQLSDPAGLVISVSDYLSHHDIRPVGLGSTLFLRPLDDSNPVEHYQNSWDNFVLVRALPFSLPSPSPRVYPTDAGFITTKTITCTDYRCDITIGIPQASICPTRFEGKSAFDASIGFLLTLPDPFRIACRDTSFASCLSGASFARLLASDPIPMSVTVLDKGAAIQATLPYTIDPCAADFPSTLMITYQGVSRPYRSSGAQTLPFGFDLKRGHTSRIRVESMDITLNYYAASSRPSSTVLKLTKVTPLTAQSHDAALSFTITIDTDVLPVYPDMIFQAFFATASPPCRIDPTCTALPSVTPATTSISMIGDYYNERIQFFFSSRPDFKSGVTVTLPCLICPAVNTAASATRTMVFYVYNPSMLYEYDYSTWSHDVDNTRAIYNTPIVCDYFDEGEPMGTLHPVPVAKEAGHRVNLRCR
jgi:hypothetical protein